MSLEDSWVLDVSLNGEVVTFDLDAVLTGDHPAYVGARTGEQYDYRRSTLSLTGAYRFERSNARPSTDATGTLDFGNIDSFVELGGRNWRIVGEWGLLEAQRPTVSLTFTR